MADSGFPVARTARVHVLQAGYVREAGGAYACTHAWWAADGPADDPFATDREALRASRDRLLGLASVIIPGHGPAFRPGERTPR